MFIPGPGSNKKIEVAINIPKLKIIKKFEHAQKKI
jgi:hypothetical protein